MAVATGQRSPLLIYIFLFLAFFFMPILLVIDSIFWFLNPFDRKILVPIMIVQLTLQQQFLKHYDAHKGIKTTLPKSVAV